MAKRLGQVGSHRPSFSRSFPFPRGEPTENERTKERKKERRNEWIRWCRRCLQTFLYEWLIASVNSCQCLFIGRQVARESKSTNSSVFFSRFVCFSWSVQMYKLHQNERANTHAHTKHTLIGRIWVRNRLKTAYHIHHHQTESEATGERCIAFSRIKC